MKPLIVLISVFGLALLGSTLLTQKWDFILSGKIALSSMLVFTAIGHFVFTRGMASIIPSIIPLKIEIVLITGVIEILLAIGLLIPFTSTISAWLIIVFFILILPANIYAAIHQINYQTGLKNGPGLSYLWFRIPEQLLFIFWTFKLIQ